MSKKFLTKIEEKFVFNLSRFFWHFIIAIVTLTAIAGILILVWSFIPAFKTTVEKENYPPLVKASYEEVNNALTGNKTKIKSETIERSETSNQNTDNNGQLGYEKAIDTLKQLIPPEKFAWDAAGYWHYPYGTNYPQYRQWVETDAGNYNVLEKTFENISVYDYQTKTKLLSALIKFVKPHSEENRNTFLRLGVNACNENFDKSISILKELGQISMLFNEDDIGYLSTLSYFVRSNKTEGEKFLEMVNSALPSFESKYRDEALNVLGNNFYKYFNNRIELQIEQTQHFLTFINKFETKKQPAALENFYNISVIKNENRDQEIDRIEDEYSTKIAQAENEYIIKSAEKVEYRLKGTYGIAAGIVAIAFLGLILVLLSMQRYLKNIDEKLGKTTL